MPVNGEAICSTAGAIAPAVNMLDKALVITAFHRYLTPGGGGGSRDQMATGLEPATTHLTGVLAQAPRTTRPPSHFLISSTH